MRKHAIGLGAAILLLSIAKPSAAQQGVGVAGHVGTLGVGVDVALGIAPSFGVRVGGNIFPVEPTFTFDDIEYTASLRSPQFTLLLDFFVSGSPFRLSGGILYSSDSLLTVEGELTTSVQIGPTTYTPDQLGSLTGSVATKDLAPYVGIGIGNPASSRFGFFLDLGVAFHGTPEVALASNGPVSSLPGFQADLEAERQQFEDDISSLTVYPVASIGFSVGFPMLPR